MEDTQDKLRRNVVALSAVIIAIAFVNPSLKDQGTLLGIADLSEVSQVKIWICALLALIYVFLRFYFDAPEADARKSLKFQIWTLKHEYARRLMSREMTALLRKGRKPKILVSYSAFFNDLKEDAGNQYRSQMVATGSLAPNMDGRTGTCQFSVTAVEPDRGFYSENGGAACGYLISTKLHWVLQTAAFIRLATFSKESIDTLVPYFLVFCAAAVCLYKIGT